MCELVESEKLKILISFNVRRRKEGEKLDPTWNQTHEWASAQGRLDEIRTILSSFGKSALPIVRTLCSPRFSSSSQYELPKLEINKQEIINEKGQILGRVYLFYKRPLPSELQMKIAYENMIEEYLLYLQTSFEIVVLKESDQTLWLFVPDDQVPDWNSYWKRFVKRRFSKEQLIKTFVLLVNSIRLAGSDPKKAMGTPYIPVVTDEQAWIVSGFFYAKLMSFFNNNKFRSQINTFQIFKLNEEKEKKQLRASASLYNSTAIRQLNNRESECNGAIESIDRAIIQKERYVLLPLLSNEPLLLELYKRTAGDNQDDYCYSCGRHLDDKKTKASKFILSAPSQRAQSSNNEDQPTICYDCAVIGFASPVKLTDEGFIVTFIPKENESDRYSLESYIRQYTLAELNLIAGQRIVLPCPYNEHIPQKGSLNKIMGTVQYALYKLATLFPIEVFESFDVLVSFGGTGGDCEVKLPKRQLITLKLLLERFDNPSAITFEKGRKKLNDAVADAIRYVQADQVTFAEYVLAREYADKAGRQEYLADDLHRKFTELLKEEVRL
jgi:hypothetical protein